MGWRERYDALRHRGGSRRRRGRDRRRAPSARRGGHVVPDATGLELLAPGARRGARRLVLDTMLLPRARPTLVVEPDAIRAVLAHAARRRATRSWPACTASTTTPRSRASASHYELLDMDARRPRRRSSCASAPTRPRSTRSRPTGRRPTTRSARSTTCSASSSTGHPDLRRILMPEDYEGHPQRRDFPIGGEPVIFTLNEAECAGGARVSDRSSHRRCRSTAGASRASRSRRWSSRSSSAGGRRRRRSC